MSEIKPIKKSSTVGRVLMLLFIVLLGWWAFSLIRDYTRKQKLSQVLYFQSDSIDMAYHDPDLLYQYFHEVKQYNVLAEGLWLNEGINVRTIQKVSSAKEANAKMLLDFVLKSELKLKESALLKELGFTNEDIHIIQDQNITGGVLLEAKELKSYAENLKDKNVSIGSRPEDIWIVQRLLNYHEYQIPIDGIYNVITDSAVSDFQKKANLYVSHRVDNFTLLKLTEE
jgi:hypothetical protein